MNAICLQIFRNIRKTHFFLLPTNKDFYGLGIHEWTLFPDIEHLANELKRKKVRRALDQ